VVGYARTEEKERTNMSDESTRRVTKRDALKMVVEHIEKPGVIDLNLFIELLTWQNKLVLWLLKEKATSNPTK